MMNAPVYQDGYFDLYKKGYEKKGDFPLETYIDQNMRIWFRELSVYDRLRLQIDEAGKQVTMKIRTPLYKEIDSNCYCLIDGTYHQVYNAARVISKEGVPEMELTLTAVRD